MALIFSVAPFLVLDSLEMPVKQQDSKLMCVCIYVCPLQAVSEEQQPGLKGKKEKEEKSKGKAKVRE